MKKLTVLMLVLAVVLTSVFAQGASDTPAASAPVVKEEVKASEPAAPATYVRGDDEEIYNAVLGKYEELCMEGSLCFHTIQGSCNLRRRLPYSS